MVAIPEYVPLPADMASEFERLRDDCIPLSDLKTTEKEMLQAAVEFLDQIVEVDNYTGDQVDERLEPLKRLLESFESLVQTQSKTRQFTDIFKATKDEVRTRSRREPELSTETLDMYAAMDPEEKLFSKMLERNMQKIRPFNTKQQYRHNADYNYLKNAAFILDHPLDPIPDEDEDDDDIQVEGGKVDLKCPLSMKIFETPMKSVKCDHTFDQEGIQGTWPTRNIAQRCPIPGCTQTLRQADFQFDRLMALRVKSYHRLQKKLEGGDEQYEKL